MNRYCSSVECRWSVSLKLAELREIIVEEEVDMLIIQEANITEDNIKFYQIRDFTMYGLFKKRKVASGILVAIRNKFTSSFEVVKEMNEHDLSEIAVVNIGQGKLNSGYMEKKFLV
ncbi:hypothetical protein JTE90_017885 [Oedothorax gibbosus]|uniref:Endonuclease/exonuclease/phosphatase domain-containing protein n=1 Tax=Oedothorax gibbosus TaxID=931172 RepID=A0AAV6V4S2_9ARAC|nr:hypothetical protein JTE90_017885 [Oedothorax gibbosus]